MKSEDLISREKAYEVLTEYYHHKTEWQHKALREALDRVPPVELQPTCNQLATSCNQLATDCISRQAAIDAIDEIESEVADGEGFQYEKWKQYFCDLPSADVPDRKVGKWIDAKPMSGLLGKVCSCCNHEAYWDSDYGQQLFGWCPWCGAEMKGKGDAEID